MNVPGLQLTWEKIVLNFILDNVVILGNATHRVESVRVENCWLRLKQLRFAFDIPCLLSFMSLSHLLRLLLCNPLPRFYPQSSATVSPTPPSACMLCSPSFLTKIPNYLGYLISAKSKARIQNIFGGRNATLIRSTLIRNMSYRVNSPKLLLLL